ncbi:hydrolase TatD [Malaciobacter halophilus]|uniref:Hydrolase TatD n=1 Tax=Malaciobacter halophilus TaxID=197482 RepID=A0A2N1J6M0_9BACT|nr:TatD family hydrolase [Malaciobacter halophilus]AXH09994.1 ssDNA/RNA exonuclease, 3' - 5' specific [Malaciobacter halophilus]PKI82210.1 hydrolase TatD [Malaciobacter halophilus]
MIIDTHCHLDHEQYSQDVHEVISNALKSNVKGFLIPGADPKDLPKAVELAQQYDEVYFSVGVHPYDAQAYDEEVLRKYVSHPKCIAIGECGLDYFRLPEDESEKEEEIKRQKEVFIKQVNFAREVNKPLIIHVRNASNDSKKILLDNKAGEVGGVLHCFNADEQLLSLANENFYFGIGGVLTFKNARKLVQVLSKIPKEKIVVETDGPYLTPHPFRGKRNEPSYTNYVVEKIAELLEMEVDEVKTLTTKNAKTLFKEFSNIN